jgi:hypothetical protein
MSDLIRQMMGQTRGPIGLGNNPSPFQIPVPDIPESEPEMPPSGALLRPGEYLAPGLFDDDQTRKQYIDELKKYPRQEMDRMKFPHNRGGF